MFIFPGKIIWDFHQFSKSVLLPAGSHFLHDRVRYTRRPLWSEKSWLLHHDNAPARNAVSVRQLLVKKQIEALDHPLYFPDLAPCDFWLFPRLKIVIKGTHFSSLKEIRTSVTKELKRLKRRSLPSASVDGKIECISALT